VIAQYASQPHSLLPPLYDSCQPNPGTGHPHSILIVSDEVKTRAFNLHVGVDGKLLEQTLAVYYRVENARPHLQPVRIVITNRNTFITGRPYTHESYRLVSWCTVIRSYLLRGNMQLLTSSSPPLEHVACGSLGLC
jgi:hypothetical protein